MEDNIDCGGFTFIRNFDSGNLGHVEQVLREDIVPGVNYKTSAIETPDYEFNIWTRPDCGGTEFENGNRTWFYFGIKNAPPSTLVKLNMVNLNRQGKMYSQGMAPVTKIIPGRPHWERVKDKPVFFLDDNNFTLSFKYVTPENTSAISYFAFTYPYTYTELQTSLNAINAKVEKSHVGNDDDIYYVRECLCYSLEKRRVDLITISSRHGISNHREDKLKNLFPDENERPFKFTNKKVVFISARVHPGETPSSFVFNGILNLLLNRHDPVAVILRRLYIFKLIPFLNPDGVANGHYRTDTRGVNLNRVYQTPSFEFHPSVYAARALIRYHHFGYEKYDNMYDPEDNILITNPKCTNDYENVKSNDKNLDLPQKYHSTPTLSQNIPRMKLAIDSEDDTSCSFLTNNTTLADQVEELNLNQSSVDGYNIIPSDSECAVDNIINTDELTRNDKSTYNDNNIDVITGTYTTRKTHNTENLSEKQGIALSMSTCFRLNQAWCNKCKSAVKDLESKMPGISQMIPKICKNEDIINKNEIQHKVLCVNCQKPVDSDVQDIITTPKVEKTILNNSDYDEFNANDSPTSNKNNKTNKSKEIDKKDIKRKTKSLPNCKRNTAQKEKESDLFLYIDLHGHASKKGIFMYGNHFEEIDNSIECMLLPRIMSLNNMHFHFTSCNFTERNMYLKDRRDGMSREGSGRVAVLKATGLMRSYTLECNYNTGRTVNILPPTVKESVSSGPVPSSLSMTPPKYTPTLFEEVGKSLGTSILDLTGNHPNSRIPSSEHRNLHGIREWLRLHSRHIKPSQIIGARQSTSACTLRTTTPRPSRSHIRTGKQPVFVDPERKENLAGPAYQIESRIATSRLGITANRPSTSIKLLPIRMRGEQPLTSKAQRNLSLISIKKPAATKHPPSFKTPMRNRSPGTKLRFNSKQKVEEPDLLKTTIRGLAESNRVNANKSQTYKVKVKSNFKTHKEGAATKQNPDVPTTSIAHRKAKIRSKETFQKQPAQFSSKPLSKRLKVSHFIKYSDNAKEKYRIRKPNSNAPKTVGEEDAVSGSVTSSGEDSTLTWDNLCVTASCSGTQSTSKRPSFKPQRPALHHLPSTSDLGTIRHKFV